MENVFRVWHTVGMEKRTTGDLIRQYRQAAGLTQRELGQRIDITDRRITAWESQGEEPGRDALTKLARVFGIGIDDLIGNRDVIDQLVDRTVDALLPEDTEDPLLIKKRARAMEITDALARFPSKLDRWLVYGQGLLDGLDSD